MIRWSRKDDLELFYRLIIFMEKIYQLWCELVKCNLNCEWIRNDPKQWILPRWLLLEKREWKNKCIVVWLNPGKCKKDEKKFYLENGLTYKSSQDYFEISWLKNYPYFKRTRDLISDLGYDWDILWTDLVKCECLGENWLIPMNTLRICINKFLRKEIEIFEWQIIFALWNKSFDFCALSFPNYFVVWLPHPSWSYWDFFKLKNKILIDKKQYEKVLSEKKDIFGKYKAIHLSKI